MNSPIGHFHKTTNSLIFLIIFDDAIIVTQILLLRHIYCNKTPIDIHAFIFFNDHFKMCDKLIHISRAVTFCFFLYKKNIIDDHLEVIVRFVDIGGIDDHQLSTITFTISRLFILKE